MKPTIEPKSRQVMEEEEVKSTYPFGKFVVLSISSACLSFKVASLALPLDSFLHLY